MSCYILRIPFRLCRSVKIINVPKRFYTSHYRQSEEATKSQTSIAVPISITPAMQPPFTQINREVREIQIAVPWGHIAGKWWGNPNVQPILLLHGWQDNAGSFDNLVPLLTNEAFFAIDMVGHGLSSHYQLGQCCHYIDALVNLRRVIKHFGWDKKVTIIGHSMGSTLGFGYTACYPDCVDKFVSIEGARAVVAVDKGKLAKDLHDVIEANLSLEKKLGNLPPKYSYKEITDTYLKSVHFSADKDMCKPIFDRGLKKLGGVDSTYCFARDPRVKVVSWGSFSTDLVMANSTQITCDVLDIRAHQGYTQGEMKQRVYQQTLKIIRRMASRFVSHEVEGTHYVHLNRPEIIAPLINNFMAMRPAEVTIY